MPMPKDPIMHDPLLNKNFKAPGLMEMLREALLGKGRPLDCVQIEVTSHCAGSCIYCPRNTQAVHWKARNMSADAYAALWPLLKQARRAHLQGWGEPFLHPRFFDFAELASRAGCLVSTTSSGLKMSQQIADKIIAAGLDMIAFSLVGTDEASNCARAGIDFATVCTSVALLAKNAAAAKSAMEIHFAYLMLADRMEAALGLPTLMEKLNVRAAIVSTLDYLSIPEQKALAFQPGETEKIAKARAILEKIAADAAKMGRSIHYALPSSGKTVPEGGCRENIARSLYVDADGDVSPCVYLNVPVGDSAQKRMVYGNVLARNALEIWRDAAYREFRAALLRGDVHPVCIDCPKRTEQSPTE